MLVHVPFPSLAILEDCLCDCVDSQDISKESYWKVYEHVGPRAISNLGHIGRVYGDVGQHAIFVSGHLWRWGYLQA